MQAARTIMVLQGHKALRSSLTRSYIANLWVKEVMRWLTSSKFSLEKQSAVAMDYQLLSCSSRGTQFLRSVTFSTRSFLRRFHNNQTRISYSHLYIILAPQSQLEMEVQALAMMTKVVVGEVKESLYLRIGRSFAASLSLRLIKC